MTHNVTTSMRLLTDFNYRENPNRVWADLDEAGSCFEEELRIGKEAELFDGLGHECMGTIVVLDLTNHMIELELDLRTWKYTKDPTNT